MLVFGKSQWLNPYIYFNTEKRKKGSSNFDKDFFKLMNNIVYGKIMENLRNVVDL